MAKRTIEGVFKQLYSSLGHLEQELAEQKSVKAVKVVDLTVEELKQIIREVVREEITKTFPDYSIPYVPPIDYKEQNPYRPPYEVWCGGTADNALISESKENING